MASGGTTYCEVVLTAGSAPEAAVFANAVFASAVLASPTAVFDNEIPLLKNPFGFVGSTAFAASSALAIAC